jgi:hypothetical protein
VHSTSNVDTILKKRGEKHARNKQVKTMTDSTQIIDKNHADDVKR